MNEEAESYAKLPRVVGICLLIDHFWNAHVSSPASVATSVVFGSTQCPPLLGQSRDNDKIDRLMKDARSQFRSQRESQLIQFETGLQ